MTAQRPARNRVSPLGEIIAVSGRGAWMGNRGRLHEGAGARDVVRNHQHKAWITCVLSFRGRRVAQLHLERTGRTEHRASWATLPDGVFVATDRGPAVVVADHLAVWDQHDNTYRDTLSRPTNGTATVLTSLTTVAILRAGYPVQIDASTCLPCPEPLA